MTVSQFGVKIIGSGSAVPPGVLTNEDFTKFLDTDDEWIAQRTGIRERHVCDPSKGEGVTQLCTEAVTKALKDSNISADELDLLIVATVTGDMSCPSTACRITNNIGATCGAFDVGAACSGFVYALNVGEMIVRSGQYKTIAVIGCDTLSTIADYTSRRVSILCGDAAGAVILRQNDDPSVGSLYHTLGADGTKWADLYIPRKVRDVPEGADWNEVRLDYLQMNGREIFKFAVTKFQAIIRELLEKNNLTPDDITLLMPHQSNLRIIEATKNKLKFPDDKVYVNIDRYGNSSSGSVPLVFDQARKEGRFGDGDLVILLAFGGGLTWASSLWRI